jgi:hypothetical protein
MYQHTNPSTYLPAYGSTALCWTLATFSVSWSLTQSVGLLGRRISLSQGRYLHTGQHKYKSKRTQTSMPQVGSEPTIPVFERAKTVHALDRVATVIGSLKVTSLELEIVTLRIPYNNCASLYTIFVLPREGRRNVEQSAAETGNLYIRSIVSQ